MVTTADALALVALADDPDADVPLSSGWTSVPNNDYLEAKLFNETNFSSHGLSYTIYVDTVTHEIGIAFGEDINAIVGNIAWRYAQGLISNATLQSGLAPGTLALMTDAANLALDVFHAAASGEPIVTIDGVDYGAGYSVFIAGAGIGGAAAEYAMERVLDTYGSTQTNGLISGVSFGGPGLSNGSSYQGTSVHFTSYVLPPDILSLSPVVPNHVGRTVLLNATIQDYVSDIIVPVLAEWVPGGKIASEVVEKVADHYIVGGTATEYANALLQQGSIAANPLALIAPVSSVFNFSLNDAFPGITDYVQIDNPTAAVIETQSGTIVVDGASQAVSFTNLADGTSSLVVSEASGSASATETTAFDSSGDVTQNQIEISGAHISLAGAMAGAIASDVDGSLAAVFSPTDTAEAPLELVTDPDGTDSFVGVSAASGTAQEIVKYGASGVSGDSISLSTASGETTIDSTVANAGILAVDETFSVDGFIQDFSFDGSSGTLSLGSPGSFNGTIFDFQPGDTIDLDDAGDATAATFGPDNVLTVATGDGSYSLSLDPAQDFSDESFLIGSDGNGGVQIAAELDTHPIAFTTPDQTLLVIDPANLSGTILNLLPGDTIDLAGVGGLTSATLGSANVLTIAAGGGSYSLNLDQIQDFGDESFLVAPDGTGGTEVTGESDTQLIGFTGSGEVLSVVEPSNLSGVIANFVQGDTIDLAGISAAGATLSADGVLTVQESGGGTLILNVAGVEGGQGVIVAPDNQGGSDIELGPAPPVTGVTYVFTSGSFNKSGTSAPYAGPPGHITLTVTFVGLPTDYAGYASSYLRSWSASAFGQTISPENADNPLSLFEFVVKNGEFTLWQISVENDSILFSVGGGSAGNYDYVQLNSSPGYAGVSGTAGVWTLETTTPTPTSMPTQSGLYVTLNGDTATAAIGAGYTVDIGSIIDFYKGAISKLILQGPSSAFTASSVMINDLDIASGASLLLRGGVLNTDPVTIDVDGDISGYGTITGSETANGTITAAGGTLDITGDVTGSGTLTFASGAFLQFEGTVAATEGLIFTGSDETLTLGMGADINALIGGFGAGDAISLEGQQVTAAVYDTSTQILAVAGSGGTTYDLTFVGTYQQSDFPVVNGEVVMPCFMQGTRIATQRGQVAVEHLRTGDLVLTQFAGTAPIKWLGHRRVDCRRHRRPQEVWPVRVRAGAFGDGAPHRDLWLSPDHAVFVDNALIPIKHLIDGANIEQVPVDEVTYYHVELPSHDVLLAEGLPTESYLETGNRSHFANGGGQVALHPDFSSLTWEALGCAPLVVTGPKLDAVRRRVSGLSAANAAVPWPPTACEAYAA